MYDALTGNTLFFWFTLTILHIRRQQDWQLTLSKFYGLYCSLKKDSIFMFGTGKTTKYETKGNSMLKQ
jgi:hypothetical protein